MGNRSVASKRRRRRGRQHKKRARLFMEQGGKCYYCGIDMVLIKFDDNNQPSANTCTIEHITDRWQRERNDGAYPQVAACFTCNNARS